MFVYDDVLSVERQIELEALLSSGNIPWHYAPDTSGLPEDMWYGFKEAPQFTHLLMHVNGQRSPMLDEVMTLLEWDKTVEKLNIPPFIIRAKANLQLRLHPLKTEPHPPHIDNPDPHLDVIYYASDSDGPTILWDRDGDQFTRKAEIEPKRGRFLVFDGRTYHSSSAPQNTMTRYVLNFNIADHEYDENKE